MENQFWSYCSKCCQNTKHTILYEAIKKVRDEDFEIGIDTFSTLECNGCENYSFRILREDFFDYVYNDEGQHVGYNIVTEVYPPSLVNYKELGYTHSLPNKIKIVYGQTIIAFKAKSFLLTGAGFRALIEAICIEEKIKGHTLEQKIDNLLKKKLITEKESDRLHSIRFLGNDSIHDMEMPTENKLYFVLGIIDNLLKNLYLLDQHINYNLDTIIKNQEGFIDLLKESLSGFEINSEQSLKEILGKKIRRLRYDLDKYEKVLKEQIELNLIDYLKLGDTIKLDGERQEQKYIILENYFLPF